MRAVACRYLRDPKTSLVFTCVIDCGSVVVEPGRNCGPGLCRDYEKDEPRGGCRLKEEPLKGDRDEPRG